MWTCCHTFIFLKVICKTSAIFSFIPIVIHLLFLSKLILQSLVPCGSSTHYVHMIYTYFVCFAAFTMVQIEQIFSPKKKKRPTTIFTCYTTVYEAGQENWYQKEGCTNHRYVALTPQTSGLCWLPRCSHPPSCVLIFSALFLTIWSIRVIGTRCITDLSLCVRVCIIYSACVYMYRLFVK